MAGGARQRRQRWSARLAFVTVVAVVPAMLMTAVSPVAAAANGTAAATPWGLTRWSGPDRFATASAIAKAAFPNGASTAVVASGSSFPDALAASYLAGTVGGPILLTNPASLSSSTAAALTALGVTSVDLVGGPRAVSATVESQLAALTVGGTPVAVHRIFGANRYDTAGAIAGAVPASHDGLVNGAKTALLASGTNFPDALAGSPLAYHSGLPLLLSDPTMLSPQVKTTIANLGITHIVILGGAAAISTAVETSLHGIGVSTERLAGSERTATAAAVASWAITNLGFTTSRIAVARGDQVGGGVDALALGVLAGSSQEPLLLTASPSDAGAGTAAWLGANGSTVAGGDAAGGPNALAAALLAVLVTDAGGNPDGSTSSGGGDVVPKATATVENAAAVTAVSGTPAGTQTTTLAAGSTLPAVGGALVLPATAAAPTGLLGLVTGVAGNPSGTIKVVTTPATLDDAYSAFAVSVDQDVTPTEFSPAVASSLASAARLAANGTVAPVAIAAGKGAFNATDTLFDCTDGTGHSLTISVDMSNIHATFSLSIHPAQINVFIVAKPVLGLNVSLSAAMSCKLKDGAGFTMTIPVSAAPPIELQLSPDLEISGSGHIDLGFTWSPTLEFGFSRGVDANSDTHVFNSSGAAAATGSAKAHAFLGFTLAISLAGRAGLSGTFGPDLDAAVTSGQSGTCLTLNGDLGVTLDAFAKVFFKTFTFTVAHGTFATTQIYQNCASPGSGGTGAPTIATGSLPSGIVGSAYSTQLSASGGTSPYAWSLATGSLPPGLSLPPDGTLAGTPTQTGAFSITVRVTDHAGLVASATLSLHVAGQSGPFQIGGTLAHASGPYGVVAVLESASCPAPAPNSTMYAAVQASVGGIAQGAGTTWVISGPLNLDVSSMLHADLAVYPYNEGFEVTCREIPSTATDAQVFDYPAVATETISLTINAARVPVVIAPSSPKAGAVITVSGAGCPAYPGHTQTADVVINGTHLPDAAPIDLLYANLPTDTAGTWAEQSVTLPATLVAGDQIEASAICFADDGSAFDYTIEYATVAP